MSKTTNTESTQASSYTIVTVSDNRLSNVTSDHSFLYPKQKKTCLKQLLQNFIQQRNGKQCIKNKRLSNYIYCLWLYLLHCYFIMQSLFNVYKNWTFTFNIRPTNYRSDQGAGFPIQESWIQNRWVVPMQTYPFIHLRLIKWVPGTPGHYMVKSKLSPLSGSVTLRQLNHIHKKEI